MDVQVQRVLIFGDQTADGTYALRELFKHGDTSFLVKTFLARAWTAIQAQIETLSTRERARFSSVVSFQDLAEIASTDTEDVVLSTLRSCVVQLGSFLSYAESDPTILAPGDPKLMLGICTGLLPAIAAAASTDLLHLLEVAVEVVRIALRLGLYAERRSSMIEAGGQSWAVVISGVDLGTLSRAIGEFNRTQNLPPHAILYISANSESATTVSGPPSRLQQFVDSPNVTFRSFYAPIYSAFHAEHLGPIDVAYIVGRSAQLQTPFPPGSQPVSGSTGGAFTASTVGQAMEIAVRDILSRPLRIQNVISSAVKKLRCEKVSIHAFGPTNLVPLVCQDFGRAGITVSQPGNANTKHISSRQEETRFAIVGMAGRFPGSDSLSDFWDILQAGKDVHTVIPKDRFDVELLHDPSGSSKNSTTSKFGCFLNNPGEFDIRMFNMSPREAAQTDPTHRLMLMAVYEALEMAGYSGGSSFDNRKIGTFLGVTAEDWREYNLCQDIDMYYVTGGLRGFIAGRLNYHFKWEGPSYVVDTACSSSAAAIELACASLRARTCDMVIAGGGNMITGPHLFSGLSKGGFISPTGSSKTFDENADGYCRGEGIGALVIKRLEAAIKDRDNIQGVIRSIATNHSANAPSITQPHAPTQQTLYRRILRDADLNADQIGYVETHGTGTQAGDTTEINSVLATFGNARQKSNPLYIGAVKSNVGHGEGAAGVTSVIKSLMMLRHKKIPPHAGIKTRINSKFPPLAKSNIHIAESIKAFKPPTPGNDKLRILLSGFGATGGNTSMILEEPPLPDIPGPDLRSYHVVTLSAKTSYSLTENKKMLLRYLLANPRTRIQDLAYTTTSRRMHHQLRSAYSVGSILDLVENLSADISSGASDTQVNYRAPIIFAFPGQGALFPGVGNQLFNTCPTFKAFILQIEEVCVQQGFLRFLPIITDFSVKLSSFSTSQIHQALVAYETSLAWLWQSWGVVPDLLIGHSIGEYSALCISGVLSVYDTFWLVGRRAAIIEASCKKKTHGMLLISEYEEKIAELLLQAPHCEIACINGPNSVVVSGPNFQLQKLCTLSNRRAGFLSVDYAFHSSQMAPLLSEFRSIVEPIKFSKPLVPIASTLLGTIVQDWGIFNAQYLCNQTRNRVNFVDALRVSKAEGLAGENSLWLEVGPESMCLSMVRATLALPPKNLLPSRKSQINCWKSLSDALGTLYKAGSDISWKEYHKSSEDGLRVLDLPTYSWTLKNYWIHIDQASNPSRSALPNVEIKPKLFSTCLHQVTSETISSDCTRVTFTSRLTEPALLELIQGHSVNGVPLCPSSVYADMASTAGNYIHRKLFPEASLPATDLSDFVIFSPLTAQSDSVAKEVEVEAIRDPNNGSILVSIRSTIGESSQEHARCVVKYGDNKQWVNRWTRQMYLIRDRITKLMSPSAVRAVDQLRGDMVYKIFSSIVKYSAAYHEIVDMHMDSQHDEAVATLHFRETPSDCTFTQDPCWMDCIAQMAGFVLNGSVKAPQDVIYMSTGWDSLQTSTGLSGDKTYLCYVRVESQEAGIFIGDVSLVDGEKIVACGTGLRFQEIRCSVLPRLLGAAVSKPKSSISKPSMVSPESTSVQGSFDTPLKMETQDHISAKSGKRENPVDDRFSSIMAIIAEETGFELSELSDSTTFEALGVDSLLTISISSRLKSHHSMELPASMLSAAVTLGQLRTSLGLRKEMGLPQPDHDDSSEEQHESSGSSLADQSTPLSSDTELNMRAPDSGVWDSFLSALSSETGLDSAEFTSDAVFADLGLDSLMSIAIVGAVKDQTGIELPASIFTDHPTVNRLRNHLDGKNNDATSPMFKAEAANMAKPNLMAQKYSSNAVLIQGNPSIELPALFMMTDGPGSAASYLHFPQFEPQLPVYALESPFLHCPYEYDCSIEEISSIFTQTIRRIQPSGPYLLGGWSIGGIYAYEVIRQLVQAGETIRGVVIIDGACPEPKFGLPPITIDILEELDIFTGIPTHGGPDKPMPMGQKQHILGCVKAVVNYDPPPLDRSQFPAQVVLMWARRGMFEKIVPKLKEVMDAHAKQQMGESSNGINKSWLTGDRTSFGPNGWDRFFGGDNMECVPIEGDHFSMMNLPRIKTNTGPAMQKAITKFLSASRAPSNNVSLPQRKEALAELSSFRTAFEITKFDYDRFASEQKLADFWDQVYPNHRRLVVAYAAEAFAILGCSFHNMSSGDVLPALKVLPRYERLREKLFEVIEDAFLIRSSGKQYTRTTTPVDPTTSNLLLNNLVRGFPHHASIHKLLSVTGSRLADCLRGDADPLKLIFGDNRGLLEDVYTNAPLFSTTTKHLGHFLTQAFRGTNQHIQILEVGAGVGGTTRHLIEILVGLGINFTYTFTDISPALVAAAKKTFSYLPQHRMKFLALDIENIPASELHGRFHTIISTNCIHATRDLAKSTSMIKRMLRADGFLVLAELTMSLYWYDLVFGLLDGWWLFDDGRKHALADERFWEKKLKEAGYEHVDWTESRSGQPTAARLIVAFVSKQV